MIVLDLFRGIIVIPWELAMQGKEEGGEHEGYGNKKAHRHSNVLKDLSSLFPQIVIRPWKEKISTKAIGLFNLLLY